MNIYKITAYDRTKGERVLLLTWEGDDTDHAIRRAQKDARDWGKDADLSDYYAELAEGR